MTVDTYTIQTTLHEGHGTVLYRGMRDRDRRPVLLKVLRADAELRDRERLEHEFEIARQVSSDVVVRPLAFDLVAGLPALVLEDDGGSPLDHLLCERKGLPMEIGPFLELALGIAAAARELHEHGVVHKDFKPENIIVGPSFGPHGRAVKVIDFGIAARLAPEPRAQRSPLIEGTLAYMAPEQTGRMNRALDARADLYAIGVCFYRMLTGRLPFSATDPTGWVHSHIALAPHPPCELVRSVPGVVSAIVLRLMAKVPEERYQSATGLWFDLARANEQWEATRRIESFELGTRDVPAPFHGPRKLFGREAATDQLLAAFEAVVETGRRRLLLVSGYAGIGKSVLVDELRPSIARARGLFAYGKFDQFKRDIPYATIADAFGDLVRELLAGSEDEIDRWRTALRAALGINGRLIVEVIPSLERLLGPQPQVAPLPVVDARARFHQTFRRFLGVFATKAHPVVLFVDDLQWADAASLDLLVDILTRADVECFLAVGAYRDNEVSAEHPLRNALDAIRRSGTSVDEVELTTLPVSCLAHLVADRLRCDVDTAGPLAEVIHAKTAGNPFFAIQLLETIRREGLITLDRPAQRRAHGGWRFDIARILAKGYTENVVDFMAGRLRSLPPRTQRVLMLAACAGNVVDEEILATIAECSVDDLEHDLAGAVADGMVIHEADAYRFVHDRVQQAAYTSLGDEPLDAVHLRIARLLVAHGEPACDRRVFELARQLNLGAARISSDRERALLARLNLRAGRRAKAQTAFHAAVNYLRAGIAAVRESDWDNRYEIAFALHLECAECEYFIGEYEASAALLATAKSRVRGLVDQAAVHHVEVQANLTKGDVDGAVAACLAGLRPFGLEMSAHPTDEAVAAMYAHVMAKLERRPIEELFELPAMTDPEMLAEMELLDILYAPAFFTDSKLLALYAFHMTDLCLEHGNAPFAVMAYGGTGFVLSHVFHQFDLGYRLMSVAFRLMQERYRDQKRQAMFMMEMLSFYNRPISDTIGFARGCFEASLESGDRVMATFAANHLFIDLIESGRPLEEVHQEGTRLLDWVRTTGYRDIEDIMIDQQRYILAMRGSTDDLSTFRGPGFDEDAFEASLTPNRMQTLLCWHDVMKMMASVFAGEWEAARLSGERASKRAWATNGHIQNHSFYLHYAVACAVCADGASLEDRARYSSVVDTHREMLGLWARHCPANFAASFALVSAEQARLHGDVAEAMDRYEEAARLASSSGMAQIEGLAYELGARFYSARGFSRFADDYIRHARAAYIRWGAEAKVRQLEARHPDIAGRRDEVTRAPTYVPALTFSARAEQLDLLSVIKASQVISEEIDLDRLICTLLDVTMEQAGAQRGFLLLRDVDEGELHIAAEGVFEDGGIRTRMLPVEPLSETVLLPISVISHVRRTHETIIVDDAPHRFSADPYFAATRPRSVLCIPIVRQAEVVAVLFLSNHLAGSTFDPENLAVLALLASQAAISLENALFVAREHQARAAAERAVRMRDDFLSVASHELRTPMTSLSLSVEMLTRASSISRPLLGTAASARLLELTRGQVARLDRLIGDLLDATRIGRDQLSLDFVALDLAELSKEVAARFEYDLTRSKCGLHLSAPESVLVRGDRSRLDQVLSNLLSNAIKFGEGKPVEVALDATPTNATITVTDHGIGIPWDKQTVIFERFERAVSAQNYGGLGLGLYIARKVVEAHGGTIQVTSRPGHGATFRVDLPRSQER